MRSVVLEKPPIELNTNCYYDRYISFKYISLHYTISETSSIKPAHPLNINIRVISFPTSLFN